MCIAITWHRWERCWTDGWMRAYYGKTWLWPAVCLSVVWWIDMLAFNTGILYCTYHIMHYLGRLHMFSRLHQACLFIELLLFLFSCSDSYRYHVSYVKIYVTRTKKYRNLYNNHPLERTLIIATYLCKIWKELMHESNHFKYICNTSCLMQCIHSPTQ